MGITFWLIEPRKKIDGINLDFSHPTKGLLVPYKIIKFRKAPYSLDSDLNEFIKFCDLRHGDNLIHDLSVFYIKDEKKCKILIKTLIGSRPSYYTTDLGGHMTTRGAFNPKSTGSIEVLDVSLLNN
ncbi:MAG: hypothetical protein ACPG54_01585 [Bizionia paragorgiae]|uniref:hypothetical protein n=1 Tax=Bizionia paragorgiae TaxID=283786 RepID=UPI003C63F405